MLLLRSCWRKPGSFLPRSLKNAMCFTARRCSRRCSRLAASLAGSYINQDDGYAPFAIWGINRHANQNKQYRSGSFLPCALYRHLIGAFCPLAREETSQLLLQQRTSSLRQNVPWIHNWEAHLIPRKSPISSFPRQRRRCFFSNNSG